MPTVENRTRTAPTASRPATRPAKATPASPARANLKGTSFEEGTRRLSPAAGSRQSGDPVAEFGDRLWATCPDGIAVAVYDTGDKEFGARAREWAAGMNAVGPKGKTIAAGQLALGAAIPAAAQLATLLGDLKAAVEASVDRAKAPAGVDPKAAGPRKVKTLALFMHGAPGWLGMKSGTSKDDIVTGNVAATIKGISSFLAPDVNVVLYACGAARGKTEAEDWYEGTMGSGGADSLAGAIRDALVDEHKDRATVYGHTTTGHTTRNFAIREFEAADGKGAAGESFITAHVWDWKRLGPEEVLAEIASRGYAVPDAKRPAVEKAVRASVRGALYSVNAAANREQTYKAKNLAEMAPVFPAEVGAIVRERWLKYWNDGKSLKGKAAIATAQIKAHGLRKQG